MDFSNKAILITGASRGIGRATARQFAEQGAQVAVHYNRDKGSAEQTLQTLHGSGHVILQADLAAADAARNLVDSAVDKMGGLDILVNNAGIYKQHPLTSVSYTEWQQHWLETLAVNLLGPANLLFCAVQHMLNNGGGKIVNVSSRGAFRGEPEAPAYGASKAGLNALSQSMAKALAENNIFVYAVAPGFVETEMTADLLEGPAGEAIRNQSPLGRVAKPEEVARTVLFLASEGSEFLTGSIVDVNGASYLRT